MDSDRVTSGTGRKLILGIPENGVWLGLIDYHVEDDRSSKGIIWYVSNSKIPADITA